MLTLSSVFLGTNYAQNYTSIIENSSIYLMGIPLYTGVHTEAGNAKAKKNCINSV